MTPSRRAAETLPHLVLFATLFGLLALAEKAPSLFERLMQEDGWAEWATFTTFLLATCVAVRGLWRMRDVSADRARAVTTWSQRSQRVLSWLAWLGLGLFCLFVAGEEISWGQRLLGFRPPALFLENNFQQESNLHNLLKDVFDTRWMVFLVCATYGVLAPYAAHVTRFPRVLAAPLTLLPWFVAVAWLEFSYPYELVGELAELMLGLLFLSDLLTRQAEQTAREHTASETAAPRASARNAGVQLFALAAAIACLPLNELSLRDNTAELVAHTERDLSALAARMQSGDTLRSALFRKREVHKRLYTAVKAGYVELERERFYLDAWNSPYWISFERGIEGKGRVLLYSFGPNRRRDLDPKQGDTRVGTGDDVKLAVEVALPSRAER